MSGNAGGILYFVFRLISAPVFALLLWGAVSLPVYAQTYYYVSFVADGNFESSAQFQQNAPIGPDDDSMPNWYSNSSTLCNALSAPYIDHISNRTQEEGSLVSIGALQVTGDITNSSTNMMARCVYPYVRNNPQGGTYNETLHVYIDEVVCDFGVSPEYAFAHLGFWRMTCGAPKDCLTWSMMTQPIEGYLANSQVVSMTFCKRLAPMDPLADWCQYTYQHRNDVTNAQGFIIGANVTLTPTANICPDVEGVTFIDELPADQGNELPENPEQPGGPELPNQETNGGGDDDDAPDPTDPEDQVDPETVTGTDELLQEMLKRQNELNQQTADSLEQLDDINGELNKQTDVLSKILNQLGNHEGDNKSASSPQDCQQSFSCLGDPIMCSILQEQRRQRCATNMNDSIAAVDSANGYAGDTELFKAGTALDFSSGIEDDPRYSSACPVPETVNVYDTSLEFSYEPICQLAPMVKPWVLMAGYLTAAFIVFRAV